MLKRAEDVLTIPESTVEFQGDSAFVQLVKQEQPEQVFEKHPVKVGLSDGIKIEIQEGLAATDKVRGAAIDPNKKYKVQEINLMPGQKSTLVTDGGTFSGDFLMKIGMNVFSTAHARSKVIELTEVH